MSRQKKYQHDQHGQTDFGKRSVAFYMRFPKSVSNAAQTGFFNPFPEAVQKPF
jgi:hypothetical protein